MKYAVTLHGTGWSNQNGEEFFEVLDDWFENELPENPNVYDFGDWVESDSYNANDFEDGKYIGYSDYLFTVKFYHINDECELDESPCLVIKRWASDIWVKEFMNRKVKNVYGLDYAE